MKNADIFKNRHLVAIMENINVLTIGFIVAGAIILLLGMLQTYKLVKLVDDKRFKRGWRNLLILMSFFFAGYLIAAFIVLIGQVDILQILTGVIFFFGAVFVVAVVALGLGTFRQLRKANDKLNDKLEILKTQNDQLTEFNYATSHDLKEPINTVIGCTTVLKSEYGESLGDEGVKFVNYIVQASERMSELVFGLSDYMQVGLERKKAPTDLGELVNSVLGEIHGSIESSQAEVKVQPMPTLNVNMKELKRVFQNLLSNALKYRKDDVNPQIEIGAIERPEKECWEFHIKDNGIGISERNFKKVFQLFRQLNKSKYDGMGIGLAITRKVVEIHGGIIWVESTEGVGTTFYFTIKE